MTIKVALAGAGAFGIKHLDAIKLIDGVEVVSLVSRELEKTRQTAAQYGIGHVTTDLADSLALKEVDAVILCTPTQMHAEQSIACLDAGKHVQVEIPLADSLAGAEAVVALQKKTGLVAMCGHTRRFNPSHQYVHNKITAGEFNIQQMDVQTYFFRRTNMNALGQPRSWTDHLLWHHAAHTVDLFAYQSGSPIVQAHALQGPIHPTLGIAMDMSIQLRAANGAICTLSLSFNNDGPLGTFFRYIGDTATYIARYDDLFDGKEQKIDVSKVAVSMNGIELQDREFFAAIREGREPNASVAQVLPCYRYFAPSRAAVERLISRTHPAHRRRYDMSITRKQFLGAIAGTVSLAALPRAMAQSSTLRFHQMLPPQATIPAKAIKPWADKVEKESAGRIKVPAVPQHATRRSPAELFDQARDGVVDIVWTVLGYNPGRFPKSEAFELPFSSGLAEPASRAFQQVCAAVRDGRVQGRAPDRRACARAGPDPQPCGR